MSATTQEDRLAAWRRTLIQTGDLSPEDIEELEAHFLEEIDHLQAKGLSEAEAFLIASKRIGETQQLSREYFKSNLNRLWKLLDVPADSVGGSRRFGGILSLLAAIAALLAQSPHLFTDKVFAEPVSRWILFPALWITPSLVIYFGLRHHFHHRRLLIFSAAVVVVYTLLSLLHFSAESATLFLTALHLPFLIWLGLSLFAVGEAWNSIPGTVHYLRFSGEAFLYAVLLGLGSVTFMVMTLAVFDSAGIEIESFMGEHLSLALLAAIPVVAVGLADRKRQLVENFAPILARIFIPLFAVAILAFLATITLTGTRPSGDRELLLIMNLLLLLVTAMLFYDVSARESEAASPFTDWTNLTLVLAALILNAVAFSGITLRLFEFGASPNRAAVFGLNLLLFMHLLYVGITYLRYQLRRCRFPAIEVAVVHFLPVYAAWLFVVAVIFPIVFKGA